jgi:hypothetical protein
VKRDTEKTRDIRVLSNKRYRNSDHQEFFIKFESGLSVIGERTQSLQAHRDFELYFREDYIFNGYLRKSFLEELRTNKAKIRSIDKYHSMLYSIIACSTQFLMSQNLIYPWPVSQENIQALQQQFPH